jgi:hypothetical protein
MRSHCWSCVLCDPRALRLTSLLLPRTIRPTLYADEMVFAEDFSRIEGGTVVCRDQSGRDGPVHRFGQHLHYERLREEREELLGLLRHLQESGR